MANEIVKVYYPDRSNNMQFAYCETRGNFHYFVENINSFVGRLDMVSETFQETNDNQRYMMYWIDEDNDKVLINSDYSLRIFLAKTNGVKKVYIVEKDKPTPETPPTQSTQRQSQSQPPKKTDAPTASPDSQTPRASVHEGVQCDHCNVIPIVGFRYKCAQCHDYDLCENCEHKKAHPDHVMYRFPVSLPRNTDMNRRFFKKMRHGCFGRPVESEGERPRKCSRRRHGGGHGNTMGASSAFSNFYTMMCDLAEGMDSQEVEDARETCPQPEPEAQKEQAQKNSAEAPKSNSTQSNAGNTANANDIPPLFAGIDPTYANAGVQALKGFSEMLGKFLDPLGITVEVDVGVKDKTDKDKKTEKEKEATTKSAAEGTTETSNEVFEPTAPESSGTQTPIIDLASTPSPVPSLASAAEAGTSKDNGTKSDMMNDGIRVFASATPSQASDTSEQLQQDKNMEIEVVSVEVVREVAAATKPSMETDDANKKRGSTPPIESDWTMIDKQFDDLRLSSQAEAGNQTSMSSTGTSMPPTQVDYAQLSRDLFSHIQAEEKAKQQEPMPPQPQANPPKPPVTVVHHPDKKINNAVIAMMAMGFSNEGGWLTNLLATVDGDIAKALELLHPSR